MLAGTVGRVLYSASIGVIPSVSITCGAVPAKAPRRKPSLQRAIIVSNTPVVRGALDNGLRLLTEQMNSVRSVSIGVWLARGSRHETAERGGIAHFVEHMLFKGTHNRSAEDIAQAIDSIGGQLDAFTAKEYAGYYIKVLDEHLPLALDILSDIVLNPAFDPEDVEREKKVVIEEIKMVEDTPDDLVHEIFTQGFWEDHPLGRPILGTRETVESFTSSLLHAYFRDTYAPRNLIISAVGNLQHEHVRALVSERFGHLAPAGSPYDDVAPTVVPKVLIRRKELEQSHVCVGTPCYPQDHEDRHAAYVLNTVLGGSMSSRLFQNIREKRGLAYAVFSSLSAYRDAGSFTIYAGCANEAVGEVVDLIVEELRSVRQAPVPDAELRRAKDHLKGSLMLGLENTASRMSHVARQEMYFGRQVSLDETLQGIERVTPDDLQRVAADLFRDGALSATVLGDVNGLRIPPERLDLQ
ncbi:MAG: insulinase family protein [Acidobacteria bacterium]|nr:insulinase family protein [Acidobacteriota bacterium]